MPKISIIGVGGAGVNGINHMMLFDLDVNFVIANTDAQSISHSLCKNSIRLGSKITKGLGAGADYRMGRLAAEESQEEIKNALEGSDMVFIAAGMGGGTGTGASPIVAKIAKELGILTVGVITRPFTFEGPRRENAANFGISELESVVDALIVISNDSLLRIATEKTGFAQGFKVADEVLYNSVRSIVELLTKPGFINRDFADLRTVMSSMGRAMIGYAEASGENRVDKVISDAIFNPILDNASIEGASSILVNITGSEDLGMLEVQKITESIRAKLQPDANFLFGTVFDKNMEGIIRVSVIATGMNQTNNDNGIEKKDRKNLDTENTTKVENLDPVINETNINKLENSFEVDFFEKKLNNVEVPKAEEDILVNKIEKKNSIFGSFFSFGKQKQVVNQKQIDSQEIKDLEKNKKQKKNGMIEVMPLFDNYQRIIHNIKTEGKNIINGSIELSKTTISIKESLEDEMLDLLKTPAISRVA